MSKNRVLRKQKMDLLLPQSKSLDNLRPSISVTDDDDGIQSRQLAFCFLNSTNHFKKVKYRYCSFSLS